MSSTSKILNVLRQKFREVTVRENELRRKISDARSETITTRSETLHLESSIETSLNEFQNTSRRTESLRSRREIKTREQLRLQSDLRDLESEMKQLLKTLKQTVIETSQIEDTKQQLEETIKEVTACEMENMEASGALETDEIKLERLRKNSSSSSKISTTLRHEDLQSLHRDLSENVKELNLELNQMIDRVNFLESRLRETRREIQDRRSNYDTKLNVLERSENELKLRLEEMKASKIRLAVDIRSEETRISSQRRQITDVRRREDRLNEDLERLRESQQHVEISLQDSIDIHTVLKSKLETSTKEFETLCMRVRNSEREIEIAERMIEDKKLEIRASSSYDTYNNNINDTELQRLEIDVRRLELDAESISKEKIVMKTKCMNVKKQIERLQSTIIHDLTTSKDELTNKIQIKRQEIERLKEQSIKNRSKATNIHHTSENKQNAIRKRLIDQVEPEIVRLRDVLRSTEERVSELEQSLLKEEKETQENIQDLSRKLLRARNEETSLRDTKQSQREDLKTTVCTLKSIRTHHEEMSQDVSCKEKEVLETKVSHTEIMSALRNKMEKSRSELKMFNSKYRSQQDELEDLQRHVLLYQEEIDISKDKIGEQEIEERRLRVRVDEMSSAKHEQDLRTRELTNRIRMLRNSLQERQENISRIRADCVATEAERSSMERQMEDERVSRRRIDAVLQSARGELKAMKNEFDIKTQSNESDIENLLYETRRLEEESVLLRDTMQRQNNNLNTSRETLNLLQSELQGVQSKLDLDQVEFRRLNEKRNSELESASKSLGKKRVMLTNLRNRVEKLQEEKRSLETQLRIRKEKIPSESGRVELAKEESRLLTQKLEKQVSQRRELEENAEQAETGLLELKSQSRKEAAEVRSVKSRIEREKDNLEETRRRLQSQNENLSLLKSQLENFARKYGTAVVGCGGDNVLTSVAKLIAELGSAVPISSS